MKRCAQTVQRVHRRRTQATPHAVGLPREESSTPRMDTHRIHSRTHLHAQVEQSRNARHRPLIFPLSSVVSAACSAGYANLKTWSQSGHNSRKCRARIRREMPCRTFCPCDASQNDTLMEQREGQFRAGTVACLRDVVGPHCWASGLPAIRPPTVPSRRLRSTTARSAKANWHEALLEAHAAYLLTAATRAVDSG